MMEIMDKKNKSFTANHPTTINVIMHCDCILNIRDTGVEVLD
jgi:hypothetical protein